MLKERKVTKNKRSNEKIKRSRKKYIYKLNKLLIWRTYKKINKKRTKEINKRKEGIKQKIRKILKR